MASSQQYSLRWNNYLHHITDAFGSLRTGEDLVDVTLSCEGKRIRAHKMLLSACSSYFRDLFKENPCQHPVIIFRNVKHDDLIAIIDFMYQGEVNVAQEQLASFLATAELLAIKGLTDGSGNEKDAGREIEEAVFSPSPAKVEDDESESVVIKPVVSSSQSFILTNNRPASPQQRKRKYSIPSVPPPQSNNFIDKKQCILSSSNSVQEGDDPIEIIPVIPNVKIENQEFFDDSYEDINDETQSTVNSLHTILSNCDPSVKPSAAELNSINSSSSLHDVTSGEIVDMEQVLMEPGTSNEILPHDSMQGHGMASSITSTKDHLGRYTCDTCSVSYKHFQKLRAHHFMVWKKMKMRNSSSVLCNAILADGRVHRCDLCGSAYKHRTSLLNHGKKHTGETQCYYCFKVLSTKQKLLKHIRKVHGALWNKIVD